MAKLLCVVALMLVLMACNENRTSVAVKKTNERLELSAHYPKAKQARFDLALREIFKGKDSVFLMQNLSAGKELKLSNGAMFYVRYDPGQFDLEMLLERNDKAGRKYFDTISQQVRDAVH